MLNPASIKGLCLVSFGAALFLSGFFSPFHLGALGSSCDPCVRSIPYPKGQGNCDGVQGPQLLVTWAKDQKNDGHDGQCGEASNCEWVGCEWRGKLYALNIDSQLGYINVTIHGPGTPKTCNHLLVGQSCMKPFGINGQPPIIASCSDTKSITVDGSHGDGTFSCTQTFSFKCGACPSGQN